MKTFYLSAITVCMVSTLQAQSYTIQDLEAQFLQKNYLLIANKLNIDKADAEIVQEKLWNN
ncbi:MAG: TolC family protein, partial [Algoriella sp.]